MREAEEIMKVAVRSSEMPGGYNLVEAEAFNAMRQLAIMFKKGEISKESATRNRERIYEEYEKEAKDFELACSFYDDYAGRIIRETEDDRRKLISLLRDKNSKIENSEILEALKVALDVIETVFPR